MSSPGQQAMRTLLRLLPAVVLVMGAELPPYPMDDRDLEIQGGYYNEDGKYMGGIPKINVGAKSYDKCTMFKARDSITASESSTSTEGTTISDDAKIICWEWNSNQNANVADGDILDTCFCFATAPGNRYCDEWTCNRVQINNVAYCTNDATRRLIDDGDADEADQHSRQLQVGGGCSSEVAAGSTKCRCDLDDRDLEYCPVWSCETYIGATKFEAFTCVRASENGLYCEAWTTIIEESDRNSFEACACEAKTTGVNGICGFALCVERSIARCGVCNLGLSIGLWAVLGILGILMLMQRCFSKDYFSPCVLFSLIWICGAGVGVALYGGQDGGMYGGIMWAVSIMCFICCCRPPKET